MVEIPKVGIADLMHWYKLQEMLSKLKSEEAMLRARIFKDMVPEPIEGTNSVPLNDGTGAVLKATHVISRTVDAGALEAFGKAMRADGSNISKVTLTKLIEWKPSLVLKEYRTLTEEERKHFDTCLVIKDGSPQIKIEIPKKATAHAG